MRCGGLDALVCNAGVMALEPSVATFEALLRRGAKPPPKLFGSAVDCTEQALLNGWVVD